jgi:hypothetical protein
MVMGILFGVLVTVLVVGGIWIMYSQSVSVRQITIHAFQSHSATVIQLTQELRMERESHSRIVTQMDLDYKALVESYLRETGKVYVRPPMDLSAPPPAPNSPTRSGGPRAFQFKSYIELESRAKEGKG